MNQGTIQFPAGANDENEPWMAMAWLTIPSYIGAEAQACMGLILEKELQGKTPYASIANCDDF